MLGLVATAALIGLSAGFVNVAPSRPVTSIRAVDEVDVVVVGSGVSGSCLAHYLQSGGAKVLLTEARDVVGGNVISKEKDGFIWEEGPNSFQPTPAVMRTAYEAGCASELVFADKTLPPWVFFEGTLHALPKNLPGDLLTFNLLTWPGKIRAGLGAVGLWPIAKPDKEETIQEFVTRHLGEETFARIIDPFVSGVYAGDPQKLSMRSALRKIYRLQELSFNGAIVPGAAVRLSEIKEEKAANPPDPKWPTFETGELGSFRKGLQTLPDAIASKLENVQTSWKLVKMEKGKAHFQLKDGSTRVVKTKAIACTAPAHAMVDLVKPLCETTSEALDTVYYPPVAAVTLSYPKTAFKMPNLPGFGSLNPRSQNVRTLGTIWSSSLFPGRCPPDRNLLLNYIGGSRDVGIADLTEEQLVDQVDEDLRKTLLKPDAPEPKVVGVRLWPKAIPQYQKKHSDVLAAIDSFEQNNPGIYLGGNYRTGVAFGDCVQFGLDQAQRILKDLSSTEKESASSPTKEAAMSR